MDGLKSSVRLILKDGTILDNCECGYSNRSLWCYLRGIPFGEAFQYFSGPDKFETIIFDIIFGNTIDRITYSGFEQITAVQQSEFTVDVRLEGYKIDIKEERIYNNKDGGETS